MKPGEIITIETSKYVWSFPTPFDGFNYTIVGEFKSDKQMLVISVKPLTSYEVHAYRAEVWVYALQGDTLGWVLI